MSKDLLEKIKPYLETFLSMQIGEFVLNCPYWMNKLSEGKVSIRGYLGGKGDSNEICSELNRVWMQEIAKKQISHNRDSLVKLAKRKRIGIDCSGLAYRVLNNIMRIKTGRVNVLDGYFDGGIDKTDSNRMTGSQFSYQVKNFREARIGDLIRMMNGRHVMVILGIEDRVLSYVHSSSKTREKGVHLGKIILISDSPDLKNQSWNETTASGVNFGYRYFHPEKGDGIYRLKTDYGY